MIWVEFVLFGVVQVGFWFVFEWLCLGVLSWIWFCVLFLILLWLRI